MKKSKINNKINIEEMIVDFSEVTKVFNKLEKEMKKKKKPSKKICDGEKEFKTK